MGEGFFIFMVAIGIIALTAVLFGGWVMLSIGRFVGRMIGSMCGWNANPADTAQVCPRPGCRVSNPPQARFCRRCGQTLQRAEGPRMW